MAAQAPSTTYLENYVDGAYDVLRKEKDARKSSRRKGWCKETRVVRHPRCPIQPELEELGSEPTGANLS